MNSEAARQGRPATTSTVAETSNAVGQGTTCSWTSADAAELDVLVHALVFDFWAHREQCEACRPEPCQRYAAWLAHEAGCKACQGIAPLTFGPPCAERRRFLDEHRDCPRCLPCPDLKRAISEVVDWRTARQLLSRAEALRAELGRLPAERSTT